MQALYLFPMIILFLLLALQYLTWLSFFKFLFNEKKKKSNSEGLRILDSRALTVSFYLYICSITR